MHLHAHQHPEAVDVVACVRSSNAHACIATEFGAIQLESISRNRCQLEYHLFGNMHIQVITKDGLDYGNLLSSNLNVRVQWSTGTCRLPECVDGGECVEYM
jgi:hypothetical protein